LRPKRAGRDDARPRTESRGARERYGGNGETGVFAHVILPGASDPNKERVGRLPRLANVTRITKMRFYRSTVFRSAGIFAAYLVSAEDKP
jgi:hypothetical protein